MNDYKYSLEKLYEHTDNGLEILHRYCPESIGAERRGKNFKIRNERTPSASLFKGKECWIIKDFGSGESFTPLDFFQRETGISDFYEALKMLCSEFNVTENSHYFQPNKTYKDKGNLPDDYFFIKVKGKVENPQYFSAFVTAELCQKYNVYEVEYFERITKNGKLERTTATENYPIFCYSSDIKKWAKTYCPAEKKRTITEEDGTRKTQSYKHGYLGKKPEKYYHGLKAVEERYNELQSLDSEDKDGKKIPYIVICSGGSDGLSVASLSQDFMPVWGNSENDIIDYKTYETLKSLCENLVYLPDVDTSGVDFAYKYSHAYWKLPIVFLPKYYLGEKGKDFRDYLAYFTKKANPTPREIIASEFKKLLQVPVSFNFVMENDKKYRVNVSCLHYFLNAHGFFGYTPDFIHSGKNNETTDFLVKINDYKIQEPTSKEVRQFCADFLIRKGTTHQILEMVKSCNALRSSDLSAVPVFPQEMDFSDATENEQLFFFENAIVQVTAEKIGIVNQQNIKNYVWDRSIIKRQFRAKNPLFEIYTDENQQRRVRILENQCDFMNFVINTSRVFWEKEFTEDDTFRSKFTLNNDCLSQEEQVTQEAHFLGKCYAMGYLLHNYKRRDYIKYVYMIDDKVKEEMGENNGRSGKGLLMQGVKELTSLFYIDGKKKRLFDDPHWLGSYAGQNLLFFDDMLNNEVTHGFDFLYSALTEGITVNQKNESSYYIPFEKSPKMVGTYNHALRNPSNSTMARILFVLFSDYYHYTSDLHKEEYTPTNDFYARFFSDDWSENQWHLFYNFMLQCVQLFLKYQKEPFLSPTSNLEINTIKASMGDNFMEWAESYFLEDKLNTELNKKEVFDDYKKFMGKTHTTAQRFRKSLENYCKLNNYVFNPVSKQGSDGRILRTAYINTESGQKKTSFECYYIETQKNAISEIEKNEKPQNDDWLDDIEF